VVTRVACAFLALVWCGRIAAQTRPVFGVQQGGVVTTTLPLHVLENKSVRRQLESGLTTTFLLKTNGENSARLEVRYDLWDEVWVVRRLEGDRKVERQTLASREALERWWRMPLRLLASEAARVSLELELSVLPFSVAEEEDARQWIAKSGGVGTSSGGGGALVDALIGTTLSARPITSYRWNVELALR
jgi:hypothetical protein